MPAKVPLLSLPPASTTLLMAWGKPPRSTVPPVLIVVALAALNPLATPPSRVAPLLTVLSCRGTTAPEAAHGGGAAVRGQAHAAEHIVHRAAR